MFHINKWLKRIIFVCLFMVYKLGKQKIFTCAIKILSAHQSKIQFMCSMKAILRLLYPISWGTPQPGSHKEHPGWAESQHYRELSWPPPITVGQISLKKDWRGSWRGTPWGDGKRRLFAPYCKCRLRGQKASLGIYVIWLKQ